MPARAENLLRHIQRLVNPPAAPHQSDAALLNRFVHQQDAAAFAALVERHGSLVRGACRRVLRDPYAAEDVAQAVWLVLARRAASLRAPERLAGWLYGTARRLALTHLREETRRRRRERRHACPAPVDPFEELSVRELLAVLDQELQRLPEVYRLPVLLCALEGRTVDEAAAQLGWSSGSVRARLMRGRARLQRRLERRGLLLSAALAVCAVARVTAPSDAAVVRAALAFAGGSTADVAPRAVSLATTVLQTTAWSRGVVLALAAVLVLAGAGVWTCFASREENAPNQIEKEVKAAPRLDRDSEALPERAIARLGTLRFRGVRGCLAYSPDGKLLATATGTAGEAVTLWDATTGRAIRQIAGSATLTGLAFSPDDKRLACSTNSNRCRVLDLETGKELYTVAGFQGAFLDEKTLLTADRYGAEPRVHLWDAATGQLIRQWPLKKGVEDLTLSRDGRTVALIDQEEREVVRVCNPETGALRCAIPDDAAGASFLALSADGKRLVLATRSGVTLWDTSTGKKQVGGCGQRADCRPVFSPDGNGFAWVGYDAVAGIMRLWGMDQDGTTPRAVGEPVNHAESPCFSPDGKRLAVVTDGQVVRFHDPATGKLVLPLEAHDSQVIGVAFTADRKQLVSRARDGVFTWDAGAGRLLQRAPGDELIGEYCAAFLPDGRRLTADPAARLFRLRDAQTGRELMRFEGRPDVGPPSAVAAPGGCFAAIRGTKGEIDVLDLRTAKCVYRVSPEGAAVGLTLSADGDVLVWRNQSPGGFEIEVRRHAAGKRLTLQTGAKEDILFRWPDSGTCVSPDGRLLVLPFGEGRLRRWDLVTGKELAPLTGAQKTIWHLAWSPDGWLVGALGSMADRIARNGDPRQDVRWWDAITGKRLPYLDLPHLPACLCFSPDGRTLATTDLAGTIRLRETLTGGERGVLRGHLAGAVNALAFSADGRLLASGGADSQAFVWDLTGRMPDSVWHTSPLDAAAREAAWTRLGSDALTAYAALWQLVADPEGTTALLREHLKPIARPDSQRVKEWIAALGSDEFAERDRANQELAALGDRVADELAAALKQGPPAEARRRLEALREALQGPPAGRELQHLRAVEVLEQLRTPEARELLRKLADEETGRVAREARAALERQ